MKFGVPELEDLPDVSGASVLVRVDFNVPIKDGVITDELRMRAALPTLEWLSSRGARVTCCTHLGRPNGAPDRAFSIEPVRKRLNELIPGVELLENLRFSPGETSNDPAFVETLIAGHDMFVNDAFGVSHRAHASVVGPPQFLPAAAGRLLAKEVEVLLGVREHPAKPLVAITGGSKVSDKLGVITALLGIADDVIIGGGMCFTFLAAMGHSVGSSLLERDRIEDCRTLLDEHGDRLHLPTDIVGLSPEGKLFDAASGGEVRHFGRDIPDGWMGVDIGPESAGAFSEIVLAGRTVLWNGPMGVFEDDRFAAGTRSVAEAVAESRGFSIIGGGDSAAAVAQFGLASEVDFISTGGGASLELIEHGDLPGLEALRQSVRC